MPNFCFNAARWISGFCLILSLHPLFGAVVSNSVPGKPAEQERSRSAVFLESNIDRSLRYTPQGSSFVITNGGEFFNRSLYGGSSAFRVDAGDLPEFSLYLPGRGGNLRLGIRAQGKSKWLHEADQVVAKYCDGMMVYEVRDPFLGSEALVVSALVTRGAEGLVVQVERTGPEVEILLAFGGVDGVRGRRDGDIGCETEPVSRFFQLRPENCADNVAVIRGTCFALRGKPGVVGGVLPAQAALAIGDAEDWNDPDRLLNRDFAGTKRPIVCGSVRVKAGAKVHFGLQRLAPAAGADEVLAAYREVAQQGAAQPGKSAGQTEWKPADLANLFGRETAQLRAIAARVKVETPDPFINAAVPALNVAADAVWDDRQEAYLHGGVAWRVRLLGWRVAYAGDALGWHERTAKHFSGFARQQNTNAIPAALPAPEETANLSRNETALHSNGDLTKSHYDMNLVGVDTFFRHLMWTGDLDYARGLWPLIERHLAWERRLFRREFGPEKLPLYEAYCCIWASDDLAFNGGGATHSSAYNLFHNRMAARVAKLLGKASTPYEHEAELIARAMKENLWLADRGWYAEWKDLLGLQQVHPNAAAWTFYHTVDSQVPTGLEAWQMTRFVDTQLARIPLRGPGVPAGSHTMPTTSWMPYTWSLNNVVLAETMHTALGYWQANRPEGAFPLFKGAVLDSMYLGLCPGNVGMCTWFDANRRESQRDFGDGVGAMARTLIEGLFGIEPDLLAGEIKVRPGFPADWNHASINHPDFRFSFRREGLEESYLLESRFSKPQRFRLECVALRDDVRSVLVNGKPADWQVIGESAGHPRIRISAAPAARHEVAIEWKGEPIPAMPAVRSAAPGIPVSWGSGASVLGFADPQGALRQPLLKGRELHGIASGAEGHRTVFLNLEQGAMRWWQPLMLQILPAQWPDPLNWARPVNARVETIDLTPCFNDRVTQIFRNEYRTPRSPGCSLATPKQGIGSWCHPQDSFVVDDTGLREAAAKGNDRLQLPNGVPLATPSRAGASNIVFVSRWDNYPAEISLPLAGRSSRAFLLMAGSTSAMQSRLDNGEVVISYTDGSTTRLALHNPTTWWPIDQDYYIDDFAFRRTEPLPLRVNLKTGEVRLLDAERFKGAGRVVPGGAATVLAVRLDPAKELKGLTLRALANQVVIGLMSLSLER